MVVHWQQLALKKMQTRNGDVLNRVFSLFAPKRLDAFGGAQASEKKTGFF
jgi:hypothetical protein